MRYVEARIDEKNREEAYRIYVTDSLKALGGFGARYADIFDTKPIETRTEAEIVDSIKDKLSAVRGEK